jgi:hypothetical protein
MITNRYPRPQLTDHGTARVRTRGGPANSTIEAGKAGGPPDVSTNNGGPTVLDTTLGG